MRLKTVTVSGCCNQIIHGNRSTQHQLHTTIIELIDQPHKPPQLVAIGFGEARHAGQQDGVITPCELDVIGFAARSRTKLFEIEPGDARRLTTDPDQAILNIQRRIVFTTTGNMAEGLIQMPVSNTADCGRPFVSTIQCPSCRFVGVLVPDLRVPAGQDEPVLAE